MHTEIHKDTSMAGYFTLNNSISFLTLLDTFMITNNTQLNKSIQVSNLKTRMAILHAK